MFNRLQILRSSGNESCFLWGPRQTGKSTLLKHLYPSSHYYDLLFSEEFERLTKKPSLLREEILAMEPHGPIIVDEVQKIPRLLDEIQWLIVNKNISFILCGSSARKLKRSGANLLGGRALRYELFPFVSKEIPNFNLSRALNNGLLPRHYLANDPAPLIRAYIGDYLKEEIAAEALTRNVPAFAKFLEIAALSNGEIVNYTNIASECGVSSVTAKEYFQILCDTLVGCFMPSYIKRPKRRVIHAPKFYFFDVGITNVLLKRGEIVPGTEYFGRALEHLVMQEIKAHSHYSGIEYPISYWRSASGLEVDFILGDHQTAVEVKSTSEVQERHIRGISAFRDDYKPKRSIVVSMDRRKRIMGNIEIMPVMEFLEELWDGKLM
ncbi:ATP-binding protein [Candidatus Peregrinibacteria bacterium]|nr:ATP-binding protein [Candidatus Peregrinibacteria bacterium]